MKKLLIGVILAGSMSSYASVIRVSGLDEKSEKILKSSSANGVCKYLGYKSAIKGSKVHATSWAQNCMGRSFGLGDCLQRDHAYKINSEGDIVKEKNGVLLESIKCVH